MSTAEAGEGEYDLEELSPVATEILCQNQNPKPQKQSITSKSPKTLPQKV